MRGLGQKIYFSCLMIAVSIMVITNVMYYISSGDIYSCNDHGRLGSSHGSEDYTLIKLKKNIFFQKTHRTSGSIILGIVLRFGVRHLANFMLPKPLEVTLNQTYPGSLRNEYSHNEPIPPDTKFNILAHQFRYRSDINEFLYPDVKRVTILRDPPEHFESNFMHFKYGEKINASFRQFIDTLPTNKTMKYFTQLKRRIDNIYLMSYDLGLDYSNLHNRDKISNFIRHIDDEFDLVMISEHLEASLVLFAKLMGWPLHYVSFISMKVPIKKNDLSEIDRYKLSQLIYADHLLYQYFSRKFQMRVNRYGFEKMAADIQKLQAINAEYRRHCFINAEGGKIRAHSKQTFELKDTSDLNCVFGSRDANYLMKFLREWQSSRLKPIEALQDFMKITYT